jgi:hypothetical protein
MTDPLNGRGHPLTPEYAFKVKLVAVVRVRAADETVARRALASVLSPPGTVDIKVTNENNAALGVNAVVTDVDFSIEESARLFEVDGAPIKPA